MNLITRLRVWYRRRHLKKSAKKQQVAPLREFVYLDEVSVYSLNASRLGSIAAEFSETRMSSLQSELGSSFSAGTQGVAKAGVNSRLVAGQARESQVVRTAIVQTVFKEFYELELELDSFAMRPVSKGSKLPRVRSLEQFEDQTKLARPDGWIVDPATLTRGRLLEVEVQLEADATYRVNTVISSLLEIIQENPELFESNVTEGLGHVGSANRILEKLLVGLIPIRGRAVDYVIVEISGKEWIVHRELLNTSEVGRVLRTRPLYVVGDAEQPLFWQDIRRVLFSSTRFQVLCRLMRNGLEEDYNPVKLADVLGSVQPELGNQVRTLGRNAFAAMANTNDPDRGGEYKQEIRRNVLVDYAKRLAVDYDRVLTVEDLSEIERVAGDDDISFDTETERRRQFNKISSLVRDPDSVPVDANAEVASRSTVLRDNGFDLFGQPSEVVPTEQEQTTTVVLGGNEDRCLESEFVAIYW